MQSNMPVMLFLGLHLVICAAVLLSMHFRRLQVSMQTLPVVLLVPLWGALMAVQLHFVHRKDLEGEGTFGVEKLQSNDELYRSLLTENMDADASVVPLEEALLINEPYTRRHMMLDVLYENPDEYYEILEEARMNDDGEIVHYATTAMAELAREYDFRLQQMEREYARRPDDVEQILEYSDFLDEYIRHDLVQGQMKQLHLRQRAELLARLCELEPKAEHRYQLAVTLIRLKEFAQADDVIQSMETLLPDHELTIMARLEYAVGQGDTERIRQLIARVDDSGIFLSAQAREKLSFFMYGKRAREAEDVADEIQTV